MSEYQDAVLARLDRIISLLERQNGANWPEIQLSGDPDIIHPQQVIKPEITEGLLTGNQEHWMQKTAQQIREHLVEIEADKEMSDFKYLDKKSLVHRAASLDAIDGTVREAPEAEGVEDPGDAVVEPEPEPENAQIAPNDDLPEPPSDDADYEGWLKQQDIHILRRIAVEQYAVPTPVVEDEDVMTLIDIIYDFEAEPATFLKRMTFEKLKATADALGVEYSDRDTKPEIEVKLENRLLGQ